MAELDPITHEVIRHGLLGSAREMKVVVCSTAYSTLWKEAGDLSCALLNARCELIAQGPGDIPIHLAAMPFSVEGAVRAIGFDTLRPGDVLFQNDPYHGNNHLPDFTMAKPVFLDGTIIGFAAVRGHSVDVGGMAPGSYSAAARDIYAEGLRLAPCKLYREGQLNEDIIMVLTRNTRGAAERLGDIRAQYAGCLAGERRLLSLAEKYGVDNLLASADLLLERSESRMRSRIAALDPGSHTFEDLCDGDGIDADRPLLIRATVTIGDDDVVVDFTGSDGQCRGGMNAPLAVTASATYYVIKALLAPDESPNSGDYRPIRLIAPERSIVNCVSPAPVVAANHETAGRIADVVMGAMARAVPDLAVAACSGTSGMLSVGGVRTRGPRVGHEFVFVEAHGSGHGASARGDGLNATRASIGNTGNTPVEALEMAFPVQVECSEIVPDSGGPGRHRGGCSVQRRYRFLEYSQLTITAERAAFPPYGLDGAGPGLPSAFVLTRADGEAEELPSKTPPIACEAGSTLLFRIAGGGGFGDPAERRREATLADVRNGYVTAEAAAAQYGVAVTEPDPVGTRQSQEALS